ncbi:MAG: PhoX family protein, partial [Actinomycetota bacterium]|nr:PhoX family protein [Actinomycetota bacterium]
DTQINCAGGVTPWGTWLSCEEIDRGEVYESDPWGKKPQVVRPEMGCFKHEACAVDPVGKHVFLTEDVGDGCLYRFTPTKYPDLSKGRLDVASVREDGTVNWITLPDPMYQGATPTRRQVPEATTFRRGEGMWYDEGVVYFATTQDDRVYAYHCADNELEVLYDGRALGDDAPLHDTDNVTVSPISGDLYVCEDPGEHQVCIISAEGKAASFAHLPGPEHANSELTGPVFDPTGSRLYFSSQRARMSPDQATGGVIFEISGPFRRTRAEEKPKDRKKPVVKVRTLGKPSLRRLLRAGQPFQLVITDESMPVKIEARLVARMKRVGGKGSRDVTIGRLNTKAGKAGKRRIRLKVGQRFRKRLRQRNVTRAKLVVIATDAKGNRRKVVKPVSFR